MNTQANSNVFSFSLVDDRKRSEEIALQRSVFQSVLLISWLDYTNVLQCSNVASSY